MFEFGKSLTTFGARSAVGVALVRNFLHILGGNRGLGLFRMFLTAISSVTQIVAFATGIFNQLPKYREKKCPHRPPPHILYGAEFRRVIYLLFRALLKRFCHTLIYGE